MPATREVLMMNGWDGGLNLTVAPQFIAPNESPDCLDVQFDARGGFTNRRGFKTVGDTQTWIDETTTLLGPFEDSFLLCSNSGHLSDFDGVTVLTESANELTDDLGERPRMAVMEGKAYFANCWDTSVQKMRSWDGTTFATLTNTFNDDYTLPDNGDMPLARVIAAHNGYMWVADTYESGTRHPSRVRFSHVSKPEDWATDDWISVGHTWDDDPITALLPYRDELLVFKRGSVWSIGGYDRDSFFLRPIAPTEAGVLSQDAVTMNSGIAYWITPDTNVFAYNGTKPIPVGDRIRRIWDNEEVDETKAPVLAWFQGRLWASIPQIETTYATFMYDPSVGKSGAWTRFGMEMAQIMPWERPYNQDFLLFVLGQHEDPTRVAWLYDFARPALPYDLIDETVEPIHGYLRTHWITAGETATKKRWRRPRFTLAADSTCTVTVDVFHDFDEYNLSKSAIITITNPGGSSSAEWDTSLWDESTWATPNEFYQFERSTSLGSATAVQLKIHSTDNTGRWWVDSIAFPFRRRQIR